MKKSVYFAWAFILALVVVSNLNPIVNMIVLSATFFVLTFVWMKCDENEHKRINKDGSTKEE